ncbi:MAG: hypothetical protein OXC07_13415 [Kistimonas sp.]|nr:hypothetical protein [Kistimonas sp.]
MDYQTRTCQGCPASMSGYPMAAAVESQAAFAGRNVQGAPGPVYSGVGAQVRHPQPAGRAQILAANMNAAIGTDDIFAGNEAAMLECMGFAVNKTVRLLARYSQDRCEVVRGAMTEFVTGKINEGYSDEAIMQQFIAACQAAEIAQQDVACIEESFLTIRPGADRADTAVAMEIQQTGTGSLAVDQARIRDLEDQLRASRESEQRLQQQLAEALASVRELQQQVAAGEEAKRILVRTAERSRESARSLEEQLSQLQAAQTPQAAVAAAPSQAPAEPAALHRYDNPGVNELIGQLTTWEMKDSPIRQVLMKGTSSHRKSWEDLWQGLFADVRKPMITRAYQRCSSSDEVRQLMELFDTVCRARNNMPFKEIFESTHMPATLKAALYDVMERNLASLKEKHDAAKKYPC